MEGREIESRLKRIREITDRKEKANWRDVSLKMAHNSRDYPRSTARNEKKRTRSRSKTPDVHLTSNSREKLESELRKLRRNTEHEFEKYMLNPETHAEYRERWTQFWNVRSIQLESVGINPSKFDLAEEWKTHFDKFLKINKQKKLEEIETALVKKYKEHEKTAQETTSQAKKMRRVYSPSPQRKHHRSRSPVRTFKRRSRSSSRGPLRTYQSRQRTRRSYSRAASSRSRSRTRSESRSRAHAHSSYRQSGDRRSPSRNESKLNYYSPNRRLQEDKYSPKHKKSYKTKISYTIKNRFCKSVSCISLCTDLLKVPSLKKLYQESITEMMETALKFESKNRKEYCLSVDQYKALDRIKGDIVSLLRKKYFPYYEVTKIKDVCTKIEILQRRWRYFTYNGKTLFNKKTNALKGESQSPVETINEMLNKNDSVGKKNSRSITGKQQIPHANTNGDKTDRERSPFPEDLLLEEKNKLITELERIDGKVPDAGCSSNRPEEEADAEDMDYEIVSQSEMSNDEVFELLQIYSELGSYEKQLTRQLLFDIKQHARERFNYIKQEIRKKDMDIIIEDVSEESMSVTINGEKVFIGSVKSGDTHSNH